MSVTPYPVSGYVSETITFCGLKTTTLAPAMPRGAVPIAGTPNWLLPDSRIVLPVMNNRADVRAMKNGK